MAFSLNDLNYEKDSKERMPWEHYTQEFAAADPKEIASRLSIPYDEETKKLCEMVCRDYSFMELCSKDDMFEILDNACGLCR